MGFFRVHALNVGGRCFQAEQRSVPPLCVLSRMIVNRNALGIKTQSNSTSYRKQTILWAALGKNILLEKHIITHRLAPSPTLRELCVRTDNESGSPTAD
eukprot:5286309-Amphidinium_carterae.1